MKKIVLGATALALAIGFSGCAPNQGQVKNDSNKFYRIAINKNATYLNGAELKNLLVGHTRVGKIRFSKNGRNIKGILNADGTANTEVFDKNGKKIKDMDVVKWNISDDGTCCIDRKNKYSCRKIYKEGDSYIAVSNGEFWAKFKMK